MGDNLFFQFLIDQIVYQCGYYVNEGDDFYYQCVFVYDYCEVFICGFKIF